MAARGEDRRREELDMAKVVGIDLGTTNSEVAVVENGVPRVLPAPLFAATGN